MMMMMWREAKSPKFSDFYANSFTLSLWQSSAGIFLCVIYLNSMQQQKHFCLFIHMRNIIILFLTKLLPTTTMIWKIISRERKTSSAKWWKEESADLCMQCVHNHAIMLFFTFKWLLMQLCITFDGVISNYIMKYRNFLS